MLMLDTNVVSELMKLSPEPTVLKWLDAVPLPLLHVCAISEAEILLGIERLPIGRRREALAQAVRLTFSRYFEDRRLAFDSSAARWYATIVSDRLRNGRPIGLADGQIAAIAFSHGARLATRNTSDFEGCGLDLINPWNA